MPKNGNNSSQTRFSDHEWEIINQIIITLAIIIHEYIRDYKNPQQVMKKYSRLTTLPTNLTRLFRTIILRKMNSEKGLYPAQIKKEIIKISRELYEKSQELEGFLSNPANLSKMLKEIDHPDQTGIIDSITGKKKIKEQSPKSVPRKRKQRDYQEEIPAGPPVVKKLTRTVEDYIKVLSNPQALNYINNALIKYAKLEEAYNLVMNHAFYFFEKADAQAYNFLQTFKALFPKVDTNAMPDSEQFQGKINSLTPQELEETKKQLVRLLLENPQDSVFFILSLAKFEDNNT